ncbi:MAG: formate dehydrogenase accessory sulfurtransferase FdhD, partial [Rubrobacter sp.]|nr:formate dehydrogenase accessory sulfurtransferase FdhD [Rubrobacter sp.]
MEIGTNSKTRRGSKTRARVRTVEGGNARLKSDVLATEEPMEVRLVTADETRTVAVTMRTPGNDFELAAGFLYGEGLISSQREIRRISYCVDRDLDAEQQYNIVNVEVAGDSADYDLPSMERHFYTTSACGVCGKASLEQLELKGCPVIPPGPEISPRTIYKLPEKLREAMRPYENTIIVS